MFFQVPEIPNFENRGLFRPRTVFPDAPAAVSTPVFRKKIPPDFNFGLLIFPRAA